MTSFFDHNTNSWSVFINGNEIILPYSVDARKPFIGKHGVYYFDSEWNILMLKYETFVPTPVFRKISHLTAEAMQQDAPEKNRIHLSNIVEGVVIDKTVILTYDSVYDFNGDLIISGLQSASGIVQCCGAAMNDRILIVSGKGTKPNTYAYKLHLRYSNVYVIDLLHKKIAMSAMNLETFLEYDNRDIYDNSDYTIKRIGEILRKIIKLRSETRFKIMSDNAFIFGHTLIRLNDDGIPSPVICLNCEEVTQKYMYYVDTTRKGLNTCCKKCHNESYIRNGFEHVLCFE